MISPERFFLGCEHGLERQFTPRTGGEWSMGLMRGKEKTILAHVHESQDNERATHRQWETTARACF